MNKIVLLILLVANQGLAMEKREKKSKRSKENKKTECVCASDEANGRQEYRNKKLELLAYIAWQGINTKYLKVQKYHSKDEAEFVKTKYNLTPDQMNQFAEFRKKYINEKSSAEN